MSAKGKSDDFTERSKRGRVNRWRAIPARISRMRVSPTARPGTFAITLSACSRQRLYINLEGRDKRLLWNFHFSELAHALFAFLLLFQKLALSRHVPAVAFRGHVLAKRAHRLACNDPAADRGLDRHLEHVGRDELLELFDHRAAAALGAGAMNQHGERVHRFAIDQDLHFHEVGWLEVGELIIKGGITLRYRF